MSARTKARKRALDILFSADVRGSEIREILEAERLIAAEQPDRVQSWTYAQEIVLGYLEHADHIDELLESYSRGWKLERMPAVDRALLRVAAWEMLYNEDIPAAVAIAEAIKLAGELSTEDSASFVGGLLSAIE